MPYEEDYKMWLEKMLIESNPDWVCDGMYDVGFTHEWCEKYCGEDSEYVTPKCLHMFYHHIARADRNSSEKPNFCEYAENPSGDVWECGCFLDTYCEHQIYDRNPDGTINIVECGCEPKNEPQTQLTAKCLECNNSKACKENHWQGCRYEPLGYEVTAVVGTMKE